MPSFLSPRDVEHVRPHVLVHLLGLFLIVALAACGDEAPQTDPAPEQDAAADESAGPPADDVPQPPQEMPDPGSPAGLYRLHCSGCHGVDGDGNGETELDRRPRDFVAGGFAFGNSREQLMRTISVGLPGNNPMPGFADKMDEEQTGKVIDHILALGPQRKEASRQERLLVVKDRPALVRGHLGPVKDEGPSHARGLLVGFPGGTSLEYRADDLRLLAVRRGEFVDRTDWSGRGGQKLKPLGTVARMVNDGDDFAPWTRLVSGDERPLVAKLSAAEIRDDMVTLEFSLLDGERTVADVTEVLGSVEQQGQSMLQRTFTVKRRSDMDRDVLYLNRYESTVQVQKMMIENSESFYRHMVIHSSTAKPAEPEEDK